MNLVRIAARRPVGVAVGVLLTALFGLLALFHIPIQLTPDVRKPTITVTTDWPGASAPEVESELTIPQEEVLKAVGGLKKMSSYSAANSSRITLEFRLGTDMDSALVLVSNRLQRVRDFPGEASRPTITTADSDDAPIVWIKLQRRDPGDSRTVAEELDFVEEVIQTALERIPGVATVNIFGGRERELRVTVDPVRLAARGITLSRLVEALQNENSDISAGHLDEGKRAYQVRAVGRLATPEAVAAVVVRSDARGPVTIGDLATVAFDHGDASVNVRANARPIIAINAVREQNANVLEIMAEVHRTVAALNRGPLVAQGLELVPVYDQTEYIDAAIELVRNNLWIGGVLAILSLLLFLRSVSATVIIALAIPISLVGAFLTMYAAGRTLNVISLAGLAFAVGMVVDPAIVVLENIVRLHATGLSREEAAVRGTSQVWGAIFIATATTVAVFLPILGLEIEAAQLFGDIAVALCAAVLFSLVVSTTVIPTLGVRMIGRTGQLLGKGETRRRERGPGRAARALTGFIRAVNRRIGSRLALVAGLSGAAVAVTVWLLPPAEYLPEGNRNLIFAMLIPPPGYNLAEMTRVAKGVEAEMKPYWDPAPGTEETVPAMRNFFFVARGPRVFMGSATRDPTRTRELIPLMKKPITAIPGTIGIVNQSSLFGRGVGGGRSLDLTITGPDLETLMALARRLFGMAREALPDAQVRPVPGLELGNPELQILPNRMRAAENGLSAFEIGQAVDAYNGGLKVDDLIINGREMDLVVRGAPDRVRHTQDIGQLPLVTPAGQIIPVSSVAEVVHAQGPLQIDHIDRERAVSLQISPPRTMPMETAVNLVRDRLIQPVEKEGLPPMTQLHMTEGADQLALAKEAMAGQFILALVITFLLMAALFESFLYPLVIIITVPLAAAGGMLGLQVLNLFRFQSMDVLTMLGFIILIGVVVNNAILIVHQALNFMADEGLDPDEAVAASVAIRVRPILMSTSTSVLGLLPLVLFPGAGSELYRGLGSVVVGGLLLSTVFTLVLVPVFFSLVMTLRERLTGQPVVVRAVLDAAD